jgi:hypothetical protein
VIDQLVIFFQGIYFSDMAQKSMSYTGASSSSYVRSTYDKEPYFLLLCEVFYHLIVLIW